MSKPLPRKPPDWMDEGAKAEYALMLPFFDGMGANLFDHAAVFSYCANYSAMVDAFEHIEAHGKIVETPNGYPMQSPWIALAKDAQDRIRRLNKELLITPGARLSQGIETPNGEEKDDFFDN